MSTSTGLNTPTSLLNSAQYCLSQECAVSAGEILSRMDLSVDPCVDFYKYACGRYARPENRPPGEFVKQTFDLPYEETERQLYYALTTNGSDYRGASSTAIRKAKDYFSACMSNPGDDAKGRALLLQIIRDLKSWPVAADPTPGAPAWNDSSWNIEDALVAAHGLNVNGLVGLTLVPHPSNSSTLVIATQPATLVLEDPLLYKDANKGRDYRDYIVQTLTLIYGTENESNFTDWANKIWDFESSVANIYPSKSELAQISNVNNLIKVGNSMPFFSWISLLNKEFQNSGVTINADTDLLLGQQQYFQSHADIIANLGPNVTQVLSAYHVWTVVSALAPYAGKSFKLAKDTLKAKLSGASCESEDTWKICLDDTLAAASFAAGAAYVQQYVNNTDTEKLDQLLGLFKDSLINGIASKQWIQEQSRQTILNRANNISWEIGTPAFLDTAAKLDQYYNNLNVSPNASFQNMIDQRRFQVSLLRQKYGKPVDGAVWTRKPTDTYSYYNPSTNKVIIQAGLLHQPMYDRNFPLAFIYGGLGSILGQKMMMLYGFNEGWWDSNTRTGFNSKATCFVDQYNALSFHQIPVNGTITAVENIADAEGLRIAYQAYMKAVSNSSDPQQFDKFFALDLSGPKQFFLGFTQLGCFNVDPARVAEAIVPNHVPSPLRVQTLLQNTPEFAEAFQCTSGSPMKLANPCLL